MIQRLLPKSVRCQIDLVCNDCGKKITDLKDGKLWYRMNISGDIMFYCQKCIEKWQKDYAIKNAVFTREGYYEYVSGEFMNGEKFTRQNTETFYNNLPHETVLQLMEIKTKQYAEEQKKKLSRCEIVDTFDKQEIYVETYGGEKFTIPFKVAIGGKIILDPKVKLPDYVLMQIQQKINQ